jgi:hypothetical protein
MSAANPNPMEKSMFSLLVFAIAVVGVRHCCVVYNQCMSLGWVPIRWVAWEVVQEVPVSSAEANYQGGDFPR